MSHRTARRCVIVLIFAAIAAATWITYATKPKQQPKTKPSSAQAVKLSQVRQWFGPWKLIAPGGDATSRLIIVTKAAKLQLGVMRVAFSAARWRLDSPVSLGRGVVVSSYDIKLVPSKGKFVYLRTDQPFVLYNQPGKIYVQTNHAIYSLSTKLARVPDK